MAQGIMFHEAFYSQITTIFQFLPLIIIRVLKFINVDLHDAMTLRGSHSLWHIRQLIHDTTVKNSLQISTQPSWDFARVTKTHFILRNVYCIFSKCVQLLEHNQATSTMPSYYFSGSWLHLVSFFSRILSTLTQITTMMIASELH